MVLMFSHKKDIALAIPPKGNLSQQIRHLSKTQEYVNPDLCLTHCAELTCSFRLSAPSWFHQHLTQLDQTHLNHLLETNPTLVFPSPSWLWAFLKTNPFLFICHQTSFLCFLNQIEFGSGWGRIVCPWTALHSTQ